MIRSSNFARAASRATTRLPKFKVEFSSQQRAQAIDRKRLIAAVRAVLEGQRIKRASISIAIVDDPTIHQLNRRYLNHDEPTDVISFALESNGECIDGQIVISAETAAVTAKEYGWKTGDELLLYAIHGTLHLVGYDDLTPAAKKIMRRAEMHYLAQFGLTPRYSTKLRNIGKSKRPPKSRRPARLTRP